MNSIIFWVIQAVFILIGIKFDLMKSFKERGFDVTRIIDFVYANAVYTVSFFYFNSAKISMTTTFWQVFIPVFVCAIIIYCTRWLLFGKKDLFSGYISKSFTSTFLFIAVVGSYLYLVGKTAIQPNVLFTILIAIPLANFVYRKWNQNVQRVQEK